KGDDDLQLRLNWAHEALAKADYEEVGWSSAHGVSYYYVRKGDRVYPFDEIKKCDEIDKCFRDQVRIRVSDHYANPVRCVGPGQISIDFTVQITADLPREEVEKRVSEAITEREQYFSSAEYTKLCRELAVLFDMLHEEE